MYRPVAEMAPDAAIGTNALHVPSGVAVSPVRTLIATLVPDGTVAIH